MKDTLLESNLGQNIKYNCRKQQTITEHQKIQKKPNGPLYLPTILTLFFFSLANITAGSPLMLLSIF